MSELHGDSLYTLHNLGAFTLFKLDFTTLSQLGIVSHGHIDRPPYTRVVVDDSDETQPLEDNLNDEIGAMQDLQPDDPARQVLGLIEIRMMSRYMCQK